MIMISDNSKSKVCVWFSFANIVSQSPHRGIRSNENTQKEESLENINQHRGSYGLNRKHVKFS